jgi:hypothetical protein
MPENDDHERPENAFATRDHARECVVQTGQRPTNIGRQPDFGTEVSRIPGGRHLEAKASRLHVRARLAVPRPNHGLATVVAVRRATGLLSAFRRIHEDLCKF